MATAPTNLSMFKPTKPGIRAANVFRHPHSSPPMSKTRLILGTGPDLHEGVLDPGKRNELHLPNTRSWEQQETSGDPVTGPKCSLGCQARECEREPATCFGLPELSPIPTSKQGPNPPPHPLGEGWSRQGTHARPKRATS